MGGAEAGQWEERSFNLITHPGGGEFYEERTKGIDLNRFNNKIDLNLRSCLNLNSFCEIWGVS